MVRRYGRYYVETNAKSPFPGVDALPGGGRNWEIATFEACPRNCEPMMPSFDNCDNGQKGHENDICEDCKK